MARKQQRTTLSTVVATISGSGTASSLFWNATPAPASVSATQTYSYSFSSLLSGSLASGATITSVGVTLPTGWSINSSARTLNYDGTGSAATTTGIVLRATNGSTTADSPIFSLTVVSSGVNPGSGTVTTIQLATTNIPGTYPFTVGAVFKKGDVPVSLVTDLSNYQVKIKRTWNDGSVKNAIISGRVTYTSSDVNPSAAGYLKTVTISRGAYTEGTALALAHANIVDANPSALVTCQGFGTVSLQTLLLSSPFRTWISGPEMVECHYRGDVGGGTELSVWFHVRLYADGRIWIRAIVENGYLDNGAGGLSARLDRTYIPTVTIGGTVVYNNGGASYKHYTNARWMAEGWIGGNPAITPKHDAAYLRSTKLVPNYGWTPTNTALNLYQQTYVQGSTGDLVSVMQAGGDAPGIALISDWCAQYAASGDARAYRATLANASSVNSYPICFRSRSTNDVVKPSLMPDWNIYGNPTSFGSSPPNARQVETSDHLLVWEKNHHPSEGYFAYLITGDYWYYETLLMQGSLLWLLSAVGDGLGTARNFMGTDFYNAKSEPRGVGWTIRTWSLLGGIVPDADINTGGIGSEYRTVLKTLMTYLTSLVDLPGINQLGQLFEADFGTGDFTSHWMQCFWVQSQGLGSDCEPLSTSDMTTYYNRVRDWMYRIPVGLFGDANGFWFGYAATEMVRVTPVPGDEDPRKFFDTWQEVYNLTFSTYPGGASALPKTNRYCATTDMRPDPANGFPNGHFPDPNNGNPNVFGKGGMILPALAYAVEHGATGAYAAWQRLINASNWSAFTDGFANASPPRVQWGVAPRNATISPMPTWASNISPLQWYEIPNTDLSVFDATQIPAVYPRPGASPTIGVGVGPQAKIIDYSGAGLKTSGSVLVLAANGGHGDYVGNEVNAITLNKELTDPTWGWKLLKTPTPDAYIVSTNTYYLTEPDGKRRPCSDHTYYSTQYIESANKIVLFPYPGQSLGPDGPHDAYYGSLGNYGAGFNMTTNDWDGPPGPFPPFPSVGGSETFAGAFICKNPTTEEFYYSRNYGDGIYRWKYGDASWTKVFASSEAPWNRGVAYDSKRDRIFVAGDTRAPRVFAVGATALTELTSSITFTGLGSSVFTNVGLLPSVHYEPNADKFFVFYYQQVAPYSIQVLRIDAATFFVDSPTIGLASGTTAGPVVEGYNAGIAGGIKWVPELHGFVFAKTYHGNLHFLRTS